MITLAHKLRTMAWHMRPEDYYALDGHAKAIEAMLQSREPVELAARPNKTAWGDPIAKLEMVGKIAVVPIHGPLVKGATPSDKYYCGVSSHEDIHEDITTALSTKPKGILLWANSPGGSVIGTEGLGSRVADIIQSGTPVYLFTGDQCCSAAEFITAACPARMCTADAITGSIGTMMEVVTAQKMYEDYGLEFNLFASGKYKGMGTMGKSLTAEQKDFLQGFVDARAVEFKGFINKYRPSVKPETMQGQIFTGRQACQNGLYDCTVSGMDEALARF